MLMLRPAPHIHCYIAAILAAHWIQFVQQYKRWIRTIVFENVRKVLACYTAVLGCHIYRCKGCGHVELIPHYCRSRFCSTKLVAGCPTCAKIPAEFGNVMIATPARHREPLRRGGQEGMVIPGTYKNIHVETVKIDPKNLDPNTEVMRY
jgi:hypothetical protein